MGRLRIETLTSEMLPRVIPIKASGTRPPQRGEFYSAFATFQIRIRANMFFTPRRNSEGRQTDARGGFIRIPRYAPGVLVGEESSAP